MGEPVGLNCPGCGKPPIWLLGTGTQAFCGSDDCPWFTWDPTRTLAELNANQNVIDLSGFAGDEEAAPLECQDCGGAGFDSLMDACAACFGTGRAPQDLGHLADEDDDG